ncbi:hypothetical protein E2C01_061941 [Portunus trituberculatus]|uniref:Uncharacterized protein n=1 Tax=Portunus trituberculatus TaxID=210409 RepID=A0A5B7HFR1_PORTR|nr:hypothetical protein [Portunus trituberculatus]
MWGVHDLMNGRPLADGGQRKWKRRSTAVIGVCACKQQPAGESGWVRQEHSVKLSLCLRYRHHRPSTPSLPPLDCRCNSITYTLHYHLTPLLPPATYTITQSPTTLLHYHLTSLLSPNPSTITTTYTTLTTL